MQRKERELGCVGVLAHSCGAMGVIVMKSTIESERAGMGCLVGCNLESGW